ncbi:MAG: response regulator transcription factor [Chitinophagales bacterium]
MNKQTILIADDHPLITEGLTSVIHSTTPYHVTGTVHDGKALLRLLNRKQPDLVLLDINMPIVNGIEASILIKTKYPQIKVVVISMYDDHSIIQQLQKNGVDGFIPKLTEGSALIETLTKVMNGKKVFIHMKPTKEKFSSTIPNQSNLNHLSKREKEILLLIQEGLTSRQIATHLKLRVYTVDTHRKNICRKLQITSPNGLVKFAMKL